MNIIAHRGYWSSPPEKNSREAFHRAFSLGFGVETDLRDRDGEVVISHDPAGAEAMTFQAFLDIYKSYPSAGTLALNIKADGLAGIVKAVLEANGVTDYFVFDMSVPDSLHYLRADLTTYSRRSEYEPPGPLDHKAADLWLDWFGEGFAPVDGIEACRTSGKAFCLVSPELHGRDHETAWAAWRAALDVAVPGAALCTDVPEDADQFFNNSASPIR